MKVVINSCFGGFSLSKEAYDFLGIEYDDLGYGFTSYSKRTDKNLIKCVETLGENAGKVICGTRLCSPKVVEIPDDIAWEIEDYDGKERIVEKHRIWC